MRQHVTPFTQNRPSSSRPPRSGPTPSAALAGGAIPSRWQFQLCHCWFRRVFKEKCLFRLHLNLWCFLACPSSAEFAFGFWFLVIWYNMFPVWCYLYIYHELPVLRCTLIWSAIREGIPGSMRPSSRLSHSHDESWTAYNACNIVTCRLCVWPARAKMIMILNNIACMFVSQRFGQQHTTNIPVRYMWTIYVEMQF